MQRACVASFFLKIERQVGNIDQRTPISCSLGDKPANLTSGLHLRVAAPVSFCFTQWRCEFDQQASFAHTLPKGGSKNFKNYPLRLRVKPSILSACASWWVWPSWLGRQIVALEVVGSNPITHPSAKNFSKLALANLEEVGIIAKRFFEKHLYIVFLGPLA